MSRGFPRGPKKLPRGNNPKQGPMPGALPFPAKAPKPKHTPGFAPFPGKAPQGPTKKAPRKPRNTSSMSGY